MRIRISFCLLQGHKQEREVLGGPCLTPNCWGALLTLVWFHLADHRPTGKRLVHKQKQETQLKQSGPKTGENNGCGEEGEERGGIKMKRTKRRALARSSSGKDRFRTGRFSDPNPHFWSFWIRIRIRVLTLIESFQTYFFT